MLSKTLILTLSVAAFSLYPVRADAADEPALKPADVPVRVQPANVSLPGIVIDKVTDKLAKKIEADNQALLEQRLRRQERELLRLLDAEWLPAPWLSRAACSPPTGLGG